MKKRLFWLSGIFCMLLFLALGTTNAKAEEASTTAVQTVEDGMIAIEDVLDGVWVQWDGNYYYLKPATGKNKIDGVFYQFGSDGKLTSGAWRKSYKGNQYYIAGEYLVGWHIIGDATYYFDEEGYAAHKLTLIDGYFCDFNESGVFLGKVAMEDYVGFYTEGIYTYLYEYGTKVQGWKEYNGSWYYFGANGMYKGERYIDGICYKFNEDGTHTVGTLKYYTKVDEYKYFFAGAQVTGWAEIDGATYYFESANGYMVTGLVLIDNRLYEFAADGKLVNDNYTGYFVQNNKLFYYENSVKYVGWKQLDGNWYYFHNTMGKLIANKYIDGVQYKFNPDGTHTEGTWKTYADGKKYFFAGNALTGWQEIGGDTYYFNPDTAYMVTGEYTIDDVTYIFDASGKYVGIKDTTSAYEVLKDELAAAKAGSVVTATANIEVPADEVLTIPAGVTLDTASYGLSVQYQGKIVLGANATLKTKENVFAFNYSADMTNGNTYYFLEFGNGAALQIGSSVYQAEVTGNQTIKSGYTINTVETVCWWNAGTLYMTAPTAEALCYCYGYGDVVKDDYLYTCDFRNAGGYFAAVYQKARPVRNLQVKLNKAKAGTTVYAVENITTNDNSYVEDAEYSYSLTVCKNVTLDMKSYAYQNVDGYDAICEGATMIANNISFKTGRLALFDTATFVRNGVSFEANGTDEYDDYGPAGAAYLDKDGWHVLEGSMLNITGELDVTSYKWYGKGQVFVNGVEYVIVGTDLVVKDTWELPVLSKKN